MPHFLGQKEVTSSEEVTVESALLGLSSGTLWLLAGLGQPDREAWQGAGHLRLPSQPGACHRLPNACQAGMSWQLCPFGQVMTFWTLAPLYVPSGEHSHSLFARGQSHQGEHVYGSLTQVLVPGAGGSVV